MKIFTCRSLAVVLLTIVGFVAFSQSNPMMFPDSRRGVCFINEVTMPQSVSGLKQINSVFEEDFSGTWPPEGWTVQGAGTTNWSQSQTSNAGGTSPEGKFSWTPQFNATSRFVSPAINTTGYSALALQFKHYVDDYSGSGYSVKLETSPDGTTWTEAYSVSPSGNVGPVTITSLVNSGLGGENFHIAITFSGNSYNVDYWYFDEVVLFEALSLDASADVINIAQQLPENFILTPTAKVTNNGTQTISFNALLEFKQGASTIYSQSVNVTDLIGFASQTITFPNWTTVLGDYTAYLTVSLAGDQNPANDMISKDFQVLANMVPKKPLYEEFTSSTCGPCAAANPIIDAVLNANPGEYSLIKYQMSWPGTGDPYYTLQGFARRQYYGVSFVPDLYANASQIYPAGSLTQAIFDQYASGITAMDIDVTASIDDDGIITVNATINPYANYAEGLKAHIVVVEKTTVGNATTNGETEFYNVMMVMLPEATGITLGALSQGSQFQWSESYDMTTTFMEQINDLAVIVFVQDDSDKAIIQSEMVDVEAGTVLAYDVTYTVKDSDGNVVEGATVTMQGQAAQTTNASGQSVFAGVLPDTYTWQITKAGLEPASGTVTVSNANVSVDVILNIPDYYFYEDFEAGLPTDWTAIMSGMNFVYVYNGKLILFRQVAAGDVLAISPSIDLSMGETLYVEIGDANGNPIPTLVVGTVPSPANYATFTELATLTPPASGYQTFEIDLTTYTGTDTYLAFKYVGPVPGFFSIESVKISAATTPPVTDIFEDFEAYVPSAKLVQQAASMGITYWATWSNTPGSAEDPFVSEEMAISGSNSVLIQGSNDLVMLFDVSTTGSHAINFQIYIPAGKVGYYNILQQFAGSTSEWGMEVYFNPGGIASLNAGTAGAATFNYGYDQWIYMENLIDLDNNMAYLRANGNLVHTWQWSLGASGGGINQLHAMNIYAAATNGTPYFFIDDIHYIPGTSVGIGEHQTDYRTVSVYPNPASDILYITSESVMANITIYNLAGQRVMQLPVSGNSGTINISELLDGLYFVEIETEKGIQTRKLVIR